MQLHNFDVSVYKELEIRDEFPGATELVPQPEELPKDISWEKLLQRKFSSVLPGLGASRIYALHFECRFSSETDLFERTGLAVRYFFEDVFGNDNVLSVKALYNNEVYEYDVLIFPLRGRIVSTEDWIEIDDDGRIKPANTLTHSFVDTIRNAFDDAMTVAFWVDEESEGVEKAAEVNLISGMKFDPPREDDVRELIYDAQGLERQYVTDMPLDKFLKTEQHLIEYFTLGTEKSLYIQAQQGEISEDSYIEEAKKYLRKNYSDISPRDVDLLASKLKSAVYGNYILEPLIDAEDISDIKVFNSFHIRVKCNGKRMTSNVGFLNPDDYHRYINSLGLRKNLNFETDAIHVFTDATTNDNFILRFNITTDYVNSGLDPVLHIRKIRKKKYSLGDLVKMNCMPPEVADYLYYQINHSSIIFCGKGGSGKTTFMNTLIDEISFRDSGLVIQESEELFSDRHPDFMFQHVTREYGLKELAQNGLLTDLDYFIIGEIKGGEALYFLNAAMTGHKCVCSVHAPSSYDAVDKLADYVMYESSYDKEQAMYMLKELKTVVYLENFRVAEISEVDGWDNETKHLKYKMVYKR